MRSEEEMSHKGINHFIIVELLLVASQAVRFVAGSYNSMYSLPVGDTVKPDPAVSASPPIFERAGQGPVERSEGAATGQTQGINRTRGASSLIPSDAGRAPAIQHVVFNSR